MFITTIFQLNHKALLRSYLHFKLKVTSSEVVKLICLHYLKPGQMRSTLADSPNIYLKCPFSWPPSFHHTDLKDTNPIILSLCS